LRIGVRPASHPRQKISQTRAVRRNGSGIAGLRQFLTRTKSSLSTVRFETRKDPLLLRAYLPVPQHVLVVIERCDESANHRIGEVLTASLNAGQDQAPIYLRDAESHVESDDTCTGVARCANGFGVIAMPKDAQFRNVSSAFWSLTTNAILRPGASLGARIARPVLQVEEFKKATPLKRRAPPTLTITNIARSRRPATASTC